MSDFGSHRHVLRLLSEAQEADSDLRDQAREAMLFLAKRGGMWEPTWWAACADRPRYTFDLTSPIVDQIAGSIELRSFDIDINPANGSTTKNEAQLIDGLVRAIQQDCSAKFVFNASGRRMVVGGFDAWHVVQEYQDDDSFHQVLRIKPIANAIDCVWFDPASTERDRSTSRYAFVLEAITKRDYKRRFPEGSCVSIDQASTGGAYLRKADTIVIGQIYYRQDYPITLALLDSGRVVRVPTDPGPTPNAKTDEIEEPDDDEAGEDGSEQETGPAAGATFTDEHEDDEEPPEQPMDPAFLRGLEASGESIVRTRTRYERRFWSRLFDGGGWLNVPQQTVFSYVPVIPAIANHEVIENKTVWRGVVERMMDPQRVYNYAKSREVEEGALAPRKKYWMTRKQAAGEESTLKTLNTNKDPVQFYTPDPATGSGGPPQQIGGAEINEGLVTLAQSMRETMNDVSGRFAASQGDNPGLQSGIAIKRLQDRGDVGSVQYFQSLEIAIAHTGKVLVDAIPRVYVEERELQLLAEDGTIKSTVVNQQDFDPQTGQIIVRNDLTRGRFTVACSAGPSFENRQEETVETITEIAAVDPSVVEISGDILFSNMSAPGMNLIAERKRAQLLQAGVIPDSQMTEEERAQAQQAAQNPPPEDPNTILAQAEVRKADAQVEGARARASAVQVQAQSVALRAQLAQRAEERAARTAEQQARIREMETQLKAQQQRFENMLAAQQQLVDTLQTQAETLNILREAMGVDAMLAPSLAHAIEQQTGEVLAAQARTPNAGGFPAASTPDGGFMP